MDFEFQLINWNSCKASAVHTNGSVPIEHSHSCVGPDPLNKLSCSSQYEYE